jgi:hypothetical protein
VLRRGYRGADDGGAVEKIEGVRYEPRRGWLKNGNPQGAAESQAKWIDSRGISTSAIRNTPIGSNCRNKLKRLFVARNQ